jgi:hypothetical protein
VGMSEGTVRVIEGKKMLDNEKSWNNPSIYEYNIIYSTKCCWILGEEGNWERVSNGELILLNHDISKPEVPR